MSCKTVIDYECETCIGDSFVGHQYTFDSLDVDELKIVFTDRYGNEIPELLYTVENGRLTQAGSAWQMVTQHNIDVEPGLYNYAVVITYVGNGGTETIIKGTKKFTR